MLNEVVIDRGMTAQLCNLQVGAGRLRDACACANNNPLLTFSNPASNLWLSKPGPATMRHALAAAPWPLPVDHRLRPRPPAACSALWTTRT